MNGKFNIKKPGARLLLEGLQIEYIGDKSGLYWFTDNLLEGNCLAVEQGYTVQQLINYLNSFRRRHGIRGIKTNTASGVK